jgi:recombination protein RecA
MMSKALRVLTEPVGKSKTTVIFINQVRTNPMQMFGNSQTTPGGDALKFYCSLRLNVRKEGGSEIKDGTKIIGHRIKISVVKNKVAVPFGEASFVVRYATGIDRIDELATLAVEREVVQLKGPMYYFGELKWQGKPAFVEVLRSDETLQKKVWEAIKGGKP